MILEELVRFAEIAPDVLETDPKPPPGYAPQPVRYILTIDQDGRFLGIRDHLDEKGKRPLAEVIPYVARTVKVVPNLVNDQAEYSLGIPREITDPKKVKARHEAYLEQVWELAKAVDLPEVQALRRFQESLTDPATLPLPEKFDPSRIIAFEVQRAAFDSILITDLPEVKAFWANYYSDAAEEETAAEGNTPSCLICGSRDNIQDTLPGKIKGIPQSKPNGAALVSFNHPAFVSYGLKQSHNAPICFNCAETFTYSLNSLLGSDRTSTMMGTMKTVFWTRPPRSLEGLLPGDPNPDRIRRKLGELRGVLRAPGGSMKEIDSAEFEVDDLQSTMFYALSLSTDTSGARVVIRDWIESMLGDLLANLKQYYAKIALLDHKGEMQLYPFWRLLGGAVPRRKNKTEFKRFHELLYRDLQRSAFKNKPLTGRFAQHVLMRCRAERSVRAEQAALLKLYLFDQGILTPTEDMMQADETTPQQPAYHCGRMLAVLESIQRRALPGIKATITDRYYGAASSSPATVFGTLVRGAQHHLSKLRRSSSSAENAAAWALENRLGEIAEQIGDSFPKYLNVEQQALFALGYYKQKAKDHRDALERKQQKEQAAAANSAQ